MQVKVWTPQHLNDEERKVLEKLKESPNFEPGEDARKEKSFFEKIKDAFS